MTAVWLAFGIAGVCLGLACLWAYRDARRAAERLAAERNAAVRRAARAEYALAHPGWS
ncbi:MAG TPA: hypothetical protein VHZ81_05680 [Galbitalea sp.]|nr:hypothetical protein [Galbitalea sp.]